MTHFLPPPAVIRMTTDSVLNDSVDLSVSPEKRKAKWRISLPKMKVVSGTWGLQGGRCEGININLFLDAPVFLLCLSFSHTRQTNPLPYQTHLSQHRLNFPLQLLIKLFRTTTRGLVFKELHPPPNVVWGVLSRHRSPEWSPKNKAA